MFKQQVLSAFENTTTIPQIIEDDSKFDLAGFEKAIVLFHAVWSGPSAACLQALASIAISTPTPWLYVVNIDSVSHDWIEQKLGKLSHGHGETLWIENGTIVRIDENYGLRQSEIAASVVSLLSATGSQPRESGPMLS